MSNNVERNIQYVIDWIKRANKHFGSDHRYKDDDGNWLDDGQYAVFITRGKHWSKSLIDRPDPTGSDVALLKQFEINGYKNITMKDLINE